MKSLLYFILLILFVRILYEYGYKYQCPFPIETVRATVIDAIKLSHASSNNIDPLSAMQQLVQAKSSIQTAATLVGGMRLLSSICNIDMEYINNTIVLQEQQLHVHMYPIT